MASNSSFQRSPSKVWWVQGLENSSHSESWHSRAGTGSPNSHKSQDSGFSDSEISPPLGANAVQRCSKSGNETNNESDKQNQTPKKLLATEKLTTDILKDITVDNTTPKKNLTENIKEKYSPKKSVTKYLTDECLRKTNQTNHNQRNDPHCRSLPTTPNNHHRHLFMSNSTSNATSRHSPVAFQCRRLTLYSPKLSESERTDTVQHECSSEPNTQKTPKTGYHSPKVSRNLLNYFPKDVNDNITKHDIDNTHMSSNLSSNNSSNHETSESSDEQEINLHSVSMPEIKPPTTNLKFNATVPLYYHYNLNKIDTETDDSSFNSTNSARNSDSDSSVNDASNGVVSSDSFSFKNEDGSIGSDSENEAELVFPELLDKFDPPTHTSTPKGYFKKASSTPIRKRIIKYKKHSVSQLHDTSIVKIPSTNPTLQPQIPSVQCWLKEVEQLYEPECMTTLQSKSIANDLARQVAQIAEDVTAPIRDMLRHSRIIVKEFNKIKTQIFRSKTDHLGPLTQSLVGNITEFVLKNMVNSQACSLRDVEQTKNGVHKMLETSGKLRQATSSSTQDLEQINNMLTELQEMFYTTENNILSIQIQLLVNIIEEPSSHLSLRAVLMGITSLAAQCERLTRLIVDQSGPRALLLLCVECKASTIRTLALRTLATVCCSTSAIRQLEQAEGVEVLADILSDKGRPEPELSEATAVLAQITAPWVEDNHSVLGLAEHIDTFIAAITDFLEKTKCCQNLLLCAAALANITYMNVNPIGALIKCKTVGKLLNAVRNRGPKASVFLKEQTATLIANLSDIPESRAYLAENNAGVALLCFLQVYPIYSLDKAQLNAAQRLQQKSAIALSRLCSDLEVAQQIVDLGGVSRLVQLCKEGKERNHSDAVLVTCLATLRKIVANCGNNVMDQQDIMELVEPRLLDSFFAYSSQNESYV